MKNYNNLQSIAYEFMDKFNLTFKTCQTALFEDKGSKDVIKKLMCDFNAIAP